jgi:hypothetical protein
MPNPLDALRKLGLYLPPTQEPLSPEEQVAQDIRAEQSQSQDAPWKQTARTGISNAMDFAGGVVAGNPFEPASKSNLAGQALIAGLPIVGGIKAAARDLPEVVPEAYNAVKGLKGFYSRLTDAASRLPGAGGLLSGLRKASPVVQKIKPIVDDSPIMREAIDTAYNAASKIGNKIPEKFKDPRTIHEIDSRISSILTPQNSSLKNLTSNLKADPIERAYAQIPVTNRLRPKVAAVNAKLPGQFQGEADALIRALEKVGVK